MKRLKVYKGWGIYQNNPKEVEEYGTHFTVLHPDNMEYPYLCSPADSDMDVDTLEQAISWIDNY
jgi:hypothetical protein